MDGYIAGPARRALGLDEMDEKDQMWIIDVDGLRRREANVGP